VLPAAFVASFALHTAFPRYDDGSRGWVSSARFFSSPRASCGVLRPWRHVIRSESPSDTEHGAQRPNPDTRAGIRGRKPVASALVEGQTEIEAFAQLRERTGLARLSRWSTRRFVSEAGLKASSARRLVAAFALGRAVERARQGEGTALSSARCVAEYLAPSVRGLEQEQFFALLLDARHRLRRCVRVGVGTLTCTLVHPREVFGAAVRESAAALIVAHNHPSGDPTPSLEDREVTRRLIEAGALLGIPVLDHVIVAGHGWCSLREAQPDAGWRT